MPRRDVQKRGEVKARRREMAKDIRAAKLPHERRGLTLKELRAEANRSIPPHFDRFIAWLRAWLGEYLRERFAAQYDAGGGRLDEAWRAGQELEFALNRICKYGRDDELRWISPTGTDGLNDLLTAALDVGVLYERLVRAYPRSTGDKRRVRTDLDSLLLTIEPGAKVSAAIESIAQQAGVSARTAYRHRKKLLTSK